MNPLFSPTSVGRHALRNRLVMAPMTRSRADDASGVPSPLATTYYAQRADAGLIITEGTQPSAMGKGYLRTPGIHTDAQMQAWRDVTAAVHAKGGRIFLQLMHCGRISHPSFLPGRATPVAPSAIRPAGKAFTALGLQDFELPRALATDEVAAVVAEYRLATRRALQAGFDGVELHAASGYLPEQFLSSSTNQRTDRYGGSIAHRARFVLEVLTAMVAEAGGDRVGLKIAPEMGFNDISDATPQETYRYLIEQLLPLHLAYLHVAVFKPGFDYHGLFKPLFNGAYLVGGGLTRMSAEAAITRGEADACVFGSLFLANPDLVQRFRGDAPLNTPDQDTFYSPGASGYTDYPTLDPGPNRSLRIHAYGGPEVMQLDPVEEPRPGPGQVVVRVRAAGVNGLDWKVRDGLLQDVFPLTLPATLGIELAGEVTQVGSGVTTFKTGDRVMGPLGGLGAYADQVVMAADKLARTPTTLDDLHAAAIPVAALTAWQALFDAGGLQRGETVLIHGAAGGVGGYAVQFAHRHGAHVVCTTRGTNADYVRGLGANQVIDHQTASFWEVAHGVDLVLDLVGGATLDRSWQVLAPTGRIVSTAAPHIQARGPAGQRGIWFQMRPDAGKLAEIARLVAVGELQAGLGQVVDLADAARAIERNKIGQARGKTVIRWR